MREPTCPCCKELRAAIVAVQPAELLKIMDKHWPDVDDFARSIPQILKWEGGYVDDPDDAGGATFAGITQGTYNAWLSDNGHPPRHVRNLASDANLRPKNEEEQRRRDEAWRVVHEIYKARYWVKGRAAELLWPLSLVHFDSVVNHGIGGGTEKLQAAVGVKVDGAFGPVTLGAARKLDPKDAALKVIAVREQWYRNRAKQKPSQAKFLNGWLNRMRDLRKVVG